MQPPITPAEAATVLALYRAEFEELSKIFGEPYSDPEGDDLAKLQEQWVPVLRTFGTHLIEASLMREAALRAEVDGLRLAVGDKSE